MEPIQAEGAGGRVIFDGTKVTIVREGVWNTLSGMSGTHELELSDIDRVRFQRIWTRGRGFIQFLRKSDPLAAVQEQMTGIYGRSDGVASAQVDEYAIPFIHRQQKAMLALKAAVEEALGIESEELDAAGRPPVVHPGDDAAELSAASGWGRPGTEPANPRPKPADFVAPRTPADIEPTEGTPTPLPEAGVRVIEQIRELAKLREEGILSDEEFQTKKAELLDRL